jgi:hypothetical protein
VVMAEVDAYVGENTVTNLWASGYTCVLVIQVAIVVTL